MHHRYLNIMIAINNNNNIHQQHQQQQCIIECRNNIT